MSVVIIGGHDRMISQYKQICRQYKCKPKVFTQIPGNFKSQIGSPDLMILFTSTVSHKMVISAAEQAKKNFTVIKRSHSSSAHALKEILNDFVKENGKCQA